MKKSKSHATRKHSDFSASASKRWINCPASVELSKLYPSSGDSAAAREGTRAHECLEYIVKNHGRLSLDAIEKNCQIAGFDDDMIEYGFEAAETIRMLQPSASAKLLIEIRVELKHIAPEMFGTLDYAWVDEWGQLVVIDYKYGKGLVLPFDEEGENTQLMYYAAALAKKFQYEFSEVKLVIIQPRVKFQGFENYELHTTSVKQLKIFEKRVKEAVLSAKSKEPKIASGDWCFFCPAKIGCKEYPENKTRDRDLF